MQIACTVRNVTFKISSQTLDTYQSSYLFFGYEKKYIETSPKTEPGNIESLSLAENFTLPMVWSPQHLNFKHLYYEKPACKGEISVRCGSVIKRFQYTIHFNGRNRGHSFLYSLNLLIM